VIRDVQYGWKGNCQGLRKLSDNSTAELCRSVCCQDLTCQVWQLSGMVFASETGQCWVGSGYACQSVRTDAYITLAGQRVSHGSVVGTSLMSSEHGNTWCTGLANTFTFAAAVVDDVVRTRRCQDVCHSDGSCDLWEYSTVDGCLYGSSSDSTCSNDTSSPYSYGSSMLGGERLARSCSVGYGPKERPFLWGIGGLCLLFLCCFAGAMLCCRRRPRKQRAIKVRDPPPMQYVMITTPRDHGLDTSIVMTPDVIHAGPTTAFMHEPMHSGHLQHSGHVQTQYEARLEAASKSQPRPRE